MLYTVDKVIRHKYRNLYIIILITFLQTGKVLQTPSGTTGVYRAISAILEGIRAVKRVIRKEKLGATLCIITLSTVLRSGRLRGVLGVLRPTARGTCVARSVRHFSGPAATQGPRRRYLAGESGEGFGGRGVRQWILAAPAFRSGAAQADSGERVAVSTRSTSFAFAVYKSRLGYRTRRN